MKIAYILYPEVVISNKSNGIRSQAETWAELLRTKGHEVDLVNNWGDYNWKNYDLIHLFGGGTWISSISKKIYPYNNNIVWSPIIDPSLRMGFYTMFNIIRCGQLLFHYHWRYSDFIDSIPYIKSFFVRSEFEGKHLIKAFRVPENKLSLVPLSYSDSCISYQPSKKEPFCLHISSIYQKRKNVIRLIKAAKKYNFKLVLAGNKGAQKQFQPVLDAIGDADNIEVLGFISEEKKIDLYKRAKVFVLPSLSEGVGIVALDAAYYGCEIAITNIPGPKEYYNGKCLEVNPYDIDSIGSSIKKTLEGEVSYQPELSAHVMKYYSPDAITKKLEEQYYKLL